MGDSLEDFVNLRPERRLVPLLEMARPGWTMATTCIHGFEPNPRWASRLQNVTRQLRPRTASLTVHYAGVTHLSAGSATLNFDNEGASLVATPLAAKTAHAADKTRPGQRATAAAAATHTVTTINLVQWLGTQLDALPGVPVVIRMDVKGAEQHPRWE